MIEFITFSDFIINGIVLGAIGFMMIILLD